MPVHTLEEARAARREALPRLPALSGALRVGGIGIARGESSGWMLKVNLEAAAPRGVALPPRIVGVPVRYEVVGKVRARASRGRR
jgi:hypothetical protein